MKKTLFMLSSILFLSLNVQATEPSKPMGATKNTTTQQNKANNQAKKTVANKANSQTKKAVSNKTDSQAKKVATKKPEQVKKVSATKLTNSKQATTDKSATAKKVAPAVSQAQGLSEFNQNVQVSLVQRATAIQNNQPIALLVYEVTNKGKNNIKSLHWSSALTVNDQIFFVQEEIEPIFEKALEPNQKETVTLTLYLDKLPDNVKAVLASNETPIGHLTVAKQIDFTNGKKIVVKE